VSLFFRLSLSFIQVEGATGKVLVWRHLLNQEIILVAGPPASGKTTTAKKFVDQGYERLNRDVLGGGMTGKHPLSVFVSGDGGKKKPTKVQVLECNPGNWRIVGVFEDPWRAEMERRLAVVGL